MSIPCITPMVIVDVFATATILVSAAGNLATALEKTLNRFRRLRKAFQA